MSKKSILCVGDHREMDPVIHPISVQFPEMRCSVARRSSEPEHLARACQADVIIFHWRHAADGPCFDALARAVRTGTSSSSIVVVMDRHCPRAADHVRQQGAVECLSLPICVTKLVLMVSQLTSAEESERGDVLENGKTGIEIVLQSRAMLNLMDNIRRAARTDATVLMLGETGTGKNFLASLLHRLSSRRHEPRVTVDCGAASLTLIESDLFGHVRGAFTGADREHVGKLERTGGGSLMLDEIDSLPLSCQTRLLRVLEERVYEQVGGERTRRFQGRVIALTNRSLKQQVAEGKFRQDLYYRLNVIEFTVPPLRERPEDIRPLAQSCVQRFAFESGRNLQFSQEALARLVEHSWPGNVRELRNVVERAVALSSSDIIGPENFNLPASGGETRVPADMPPQSSLSEVRHTAERHELLRVLRANGNNRTRAASQLGISRSAFYKRLDKLGIGASGPKHELAPAGADGW
jgi:DNA-binding NtrC family response regulator